MRKILSILLIAAFLCVGNSAYARVGQSRIGLIRLQSTGIIIPHTHVRTDPGLIYRISFTANKARAWVAIIDSSTTGDADTVQAYLTNIVSGDANSRILVDISEATAGDSVTITYDPPLEFRNGIMVSYGTTDSSGVLIDLGQVGSGVEAATVIIHYGE